MRNLIDDDLGIMDLIFVPLALVSILIEAMWKGWGQLFEPRKKVRFSEIRMKNIPPIPYGGRPIRDKTVDEIRESLNLARIGKLEYDLDLMYFRNAWEFEPHIRLFIR